MLDVSKIPETMKLRDRGSLLTGLIAGLADHEHAVAMVCVKTEEMAKKGDFLFITKNGQVKRTTAAEYGIRRARFAAINLKDEDELVGMVQVDPDDKDDIILITRLGTALRFRLDTVSCTGRATAGVRGMDAVSYTHLCWEQQADDVNHSGGQHRRDQTADSLSACAGVKKQIDANA